MTGACVVGSFGRSSPSLPMAGDSASATGASITTGDVRVFGDNLFWLVWVVFVFKLQL